MQLHAINRYFTKFASWQLRYRGAILLFLLVFTVGALSGLPLIQSKVSEDSFLSRDDLIIQQTERFERLFGNNEYVAVLVEADDVFAPEVLRAVDEIGHELLTKVPYAERINSITTVGIVIGDDEGIRVSNPFQNGIPDNAAAIASAKQLILSRQALVGSLVSADARETWLVLSLRPFPDEPVWLAAGEQNPLYQVGEPAVEILTNPKWQSAAYTLKPVGIPYTETEERSFMSKEMPWRIGCGFMLMIALLVVFVRSWRGVLIPTFTTVLGVSVVFGSMGWLGITVDGGMAMLPIFLGMALSVGYSIHIINAIKRHLQTHTRREAIIAAVGECGWPIAFTAITTIGSMLSFVSAGIGITTWLGLVSAAVVATVYVYVVLLVPILFSFGKTQKPKIKAFNNRIWQALAQWVLTRPTTLVLGGALVIMLMLPALFRIEVNMDTLEMMGTKVPYLQRVDDVMRSQLGSYIHYNILIDYDNEDAFKHPTTMHNLVVLSDEIGRLALTKKTGDRAKVSSIADVVREMNQSLNGDNRDFYRIPKDRALIAQLLLLYELSGGKTMYEQIDNHYRSARIQVELETFAAKEITAELAIVRQRAAELFPNATVTMVGTAVEFAEINKRLVKAELISFFTALLVIGILMMLVFGSIKTGLIGLLPNFAPVLMIGALMGYGTINLDMMTMMIMPMMLGVAVDDTIHFINHIKYTFEKTGDYYHAIVETFTTVGRNLSMTTIILCAAFGVFMTSPLNMIHRIGLMAIVGLCAALIADYLLTPALIYLTKPFGKPSIKE